MARITKAVITAAGMGTRHFPATQTLQKEMMPLVDRDGTTKPTIQIIVEEARESGIEEFCLVVAPHSQERLRAHFQGLPPEHARHFRGKSWAIEESERLVELGRRIRYVVQTTQEGYGHAVHCAREFVGGEPFLLIPGDHVCLSTSQKLCSRQVMDIFHAFGTPVSAVQRTHADFLHLYGTVVGHCLADAPRVYEVTALKEKPTVEYAEEFLRVPGLGRDEYLCFFAMHAFPPEIFAILESHIRGDVRDRGEIQLTSAQEELRRQGRYLAAEIEGARYDMGVPMGYIETQLALALNSPARRQVMARLPHLLTLSDPEQLR